MVQLFICHLKLIIKMKTETQNNFWQWVVFMLGAGGYIPLIIGGIQHPAEINVATYSLWLILCSMIAYSSWKQKFAGWFMPFGWVIGQAGIIMTALYIGGYTFNLGTEEMIVFYGIIITISLWGIIGQQTGKWNPRILFLGSVFADILSFYPQIKQYLLPHDSPTIWLVIGWSMFIADTIVNLIFVEKLPQKLTTPKERYEIKYGEEKQTLRLLESSLLSLENMILVSATLALMLW
jgi:hypothetical protein